jgi:hypothetical protein
MLTNHEDLSIIGYGVSMMIYNYIEINPGIAPGILMLYPFGEIYMIKGR